MFRVNHLKISILWTLFYVVKSTINEMIYFIFVHQGTNDVMDITQMTSGCRNGMYVLLSCETFSFYIIIFKPKCLVSNI